MKVVINVCFGGFGISEAGYEKLIEWGIPVRKYAEYAEQTRDPATGLFHRPPENEGEVIFDRDLDAPDSDDIQARLRSSSMRRLSGRYWETWLNKSRTHPLLIRLVEEMGEAADGPYAKLKVVEIPDGIEWEIDEYDGTEQVAECHRTWF